jgi:type IV fimbrial biogenesis protein FimT
MRRRARGLTLLELLVTLAIVAVMMTLALPSFGSMVARHRLKAAAEQLSADLGELRLMAAQRGQPLHLNLQPGPQWCYALATASGCDCRVPQSCQLKTVRATHHPGVTLLAGGDMRVDGRNVGPLQDSGQALLQGSEGGQLRVSLTPLGRPKVCAPGGAVPGYPGC